MSSENLCLTFSGISPKNKFFKKFSTFTEVLSIFSLYPELISLSPEYTFVVIFTSLPIVYKIGVLLLPLNSWVNIKVLLLLFSSTFKSSPPDKNNFVLSVEYFIVISYFKFSVLLDSKLNFLRTPTSSFWNLQVHKLENSIFPIISL